MRPDRTERPIDLATERSMERANERAADEVTNRAAERAVDRPDRATTPRPGDTEPERRLSVAEASRIDPVEPDASVWQRIKGRFVDDPDGAIAAAEALVHRTVERKVRALEEEAATLCGRDSGDDAPSTEARRTRLLRYQAYYERLTGLSVH
jgi:hypothetical protein